MTEVRRRPLVVELCFYRERLPRGRGLGRGDGLRDRPVQAARQVPRGELGVFPFTWSVLGLSPSL